MRRRHENRSARISDLRSVVSQEDQSEQEPARKRRLLNDQDAASRRYRCSQPNCNMAFKYKCHLDRHLKTAHQLCEEMLHCGYCDRKYGHLDSIRQHLKRRHGNLEQKMTRVPVEESQSAGMPGASEANGLKREVKPELSPDENRD